MARYEFRSFQMARDGLGCFQVWEFSKWPEIVREGLPVELLEQVFSLRGFHDKCNVNLENWQPTTC